MPEGNEKSAARKNKEEQKKPCRREGMEKASPLREGHRSAPESASHKS